jgi:phenylacetic acid degradation operon negative regulatory protein
MSSMRDTLRSQVPSVAPRNLSARSVVASTLLGADPPELPVRTIVRCGALFGLNPGAVRTAVSRMAADGSLTVDPDRPVYRVAGRLVARRARQVEGRDPAAVGGRWDGDWTQVVVVAPSRSAAERSAFRSAATTLRLAELREGVWLRPDNLDPRRHPEASTVVDAHTTTFTSRPGDPSSLAAMLWDLDGWSDTAGTLERLLADHVEVIAGDDDPAVLADGFLLSASVLRHLVADPLLPLQLCGPRWPGRRLRTTYDTYDRIYKERWRGWFRIQTQR